MNPEEIVLLFADEYSRMAEAYDSHVTPHFEPIARRVVELANPKPGEMFLDLGAGTGLLACLVAPKVSPQGVVAIDLADGALARGTYRAAGLGIRSVRFEMMDVRNIIYSGRMFDGVASNFGVPAFGFDRCFAEVSRVLKPTGRFVFSEWGDFAEPAFEAFLRVLEKHRVPDPPKKLAELRAAVDSYRKSDALRDLHDPNKVTAALRKAGFRRVDVETVLHREVFDPRDSFLDFRLSWGFNEAEVRAMAPEAGEAFLEEMGRELRGLGEGGGLEVDWVIHYFVARPE